MTDPHDARRRDPLFFDPKSMMLGRDPVDPAVLLRRCEDFARGVWEQHGRETQETLLLDRTFASPEALRAAYDEARRQAANDYRRVVGPLYKAAKRAGTEKAMFACHEARTPAWNVWRARDDILRVVMEYRLELIS